MMASQPSPLAYCQSMKSTATRMPVPRRLCPPSMALTWPFSVGQKNRKQRDELLSSLLSGRKEEDVNAQIDCLCKREAGKSFKAASLGRCAHLLCTQTHTYTRARTHTHTRAPNIRGPWVVVYTRGPPQLWKASQSVATLLSGKNRASQVCLLKAVTLKPQCRVCAYVLKLKFEANLRLQYLHVRKGHKHTCSDKVHNNKQMLVAFNSVPL
jgi:hypothetical protein